MKGNHLKALILVLSVSFLVASNMFCLKKWSMVSCGEEHTLALSEHGQLYAWGNNQDWQLGVYPRKYDIDSSPTSVMPLETFKFVATKYFTSFAITTSGKLFYWGRDLFSFYPPRHQARPVQVGNDADWKSVAVGEHHILALKENGTLYAWGQGNHGQLGNGNETIARIPVQIMPNTTWKAIAAGESHSFAIRDDGALFAWGEGTFATLGEGIRTHRSTPVRVGGSKLFSMVSAGLHHTLAIDTEDNFYSWGDNYYKQLGTYNINHTNVPVTPEFMNISKWKVVSANFVISLAIREDESLWAFGDYTFGQHGQPNRDVQPTTPMQILPGQKWKSISAGDVHAFGITTDGNLIGWGSAELGRLGDGTEEESYRLPEFCGRKDNQKGRLLSRALRGLVKIVKNQA